MYVSLEAGAAAATGLAPAAVGPTPAAGGINSAAGAAAATGPASTAGVPAPATEGINPGDAAAAPTATPTAAGPTPSAAAVPGLVDPVPGKEEENHGSDSDDDPADISGDKPRQLAALRCLIVHGPPVVQQAAVGALLARMQVDKDCLAEEVFVPSGVKEALYAPFLGPLIHVLGSGTPAARERAAGAIPRLMACGDSAARDAAVAAGIIEALFRLLDHEIDPTRRQGYVALTQIRQVGVPMFNTMVAKRLIGLSLELLARERSTPEAKVSALTILHDMTSNPEDLALALAAGALTPVLFHLEHGTRDARDAAAAFLEDLGLESGGLHKGVEDPDEVLPDLVRLLKEGPLEAKEAVAHLFVFMCDMSTHRERLIKAGVVGPLLEILTTKKWSREESPLAMEAAATALYWLGLQSDKNKALIAAAGAVKPLIRLLGEGTPDAREFAAGALRNLSSDYENQKLLISQGVIRRLLALLKDGNPEAKDHAVGILSNLVEDYKASPPPSPSP